MIRLLTYLAQILPEDQVNLQDNKITSTTVVDLVQLVSGIGGAIALIVVTIASMKYVFSQGEPDKIGNAKNTIIYALIGLAVCITAFSIVTFAVREIKA